MLIFRGVSDNMKPGTFVKGVLESLNIWVLAYLGYVLRDLLEIS